MVKKWGCLRSRSKSQRGAGIYESTYEQEVIPMGKRRYRAVRVKCLSMDRVMEGVEGQELIVGLDAAKEEFVAALRVRGEGVIQTVKWRHPGESLEAVELLSSLPAASLEVALEPTSSYGDAVRGLLLGEGIGVYRVSPKRAHDLREVYDGVPSAHDGKSAAVVAKLHEDGASEPWPLRREAERELSAGVRLLGIYEQQMHANLNRLEALVARHWPELPEVLELGSATALALLEAYGGPQAVARDAQGARALMRRASRGALKPDRLEAVLAAAGSSVGLPLLAAERAMVQELVAEIRRNRERAREVQARVEAQGAQHPAVAQLGKTVGRKSAAVLVSEAGDPRAYRNASSYQKSLGLNLAEVSSGKRKGQRAISKRGPGLARWYLYLAALRLVQKDEITGAWYEAKVERDAGYKGKAVVAVMRKLSLALWHVAHGAAFDSRRLFDVSRLEVA